MYSNMYEELYHFGIAGMSWGKRRYQNKDGSLTPEGYIHYGYGHGEKKNKAKSGEEVEETDDYKMTNKVGSDGKVRSSFETKKPIGYSDPDGKLYDTNKGSIDPFVNDKNYTAKDMNNAIKKCFELAKSNKDNIKEIEDAIDTADDIWDSYDPKRHTGVWAQKNEKTGKWEFESYYVPKQLFDGSDDQPWYSTFEVDDIFNPTYCKYKGGGVV